MKRLFLVALAAAAALFGTAGAQAKAPPDGIDICGATEACLHLAVSDAESEWSLWSTAGYAVPASGASSFYVLRWNWPNGFAAEPLGADDRGLLLAQVAERLERPAVDPGGATRADDRRMARRDVPDVRGEAVVREDRVHPPHDTIARHLRDDRRGC